MNEVIQEQSHRSGLVMIHPWQMIKYSTMWRFHLGFDQWNLPVHKKVSGIFLIMRKYVLNEIHFYFIGQISQRLIFLHTGLIY